MVGAQLLAGFLATMPEGAGEMHASMLQMVGSMPMGRFATDFGSAIPSGELDRLMAAAREARAG